MSVPGAKPSVPGATNVATAVARRSAPYRMRLALGTPSRLPTSSVTRSNTAAGVASAATSVAIRRSAVCSPARTRVARSLSTRRRSGARRSGMSASVATTLSGRTPPRAPLGRPGAAERGPGADRDPAPLAARLAHLGDEPGLGRAGTQRALPQQPLGRDRRAVAVDHAVEHRLGPVAAQLPARPAEDLLRGGVAVGDDSLRVAHDQPLGHRVHDRA